MRKDYTFRDMASEHNREEVDAEEIDMTIHH